MKETPDKKGLQEPLHRDTWGTFELFGRPAYADSGLCLVGEPPTGETDDISEWGRERLHKALALKTAAMSVRLRDSEHVYFDGLDLPVDVRYYEHVLSVFPEATFHLPKRGDATKPITIKNGGEIVGALMCMNVL